jgi:hypothetical protein
MSSSLTPPQSSTDQQTNELYNPTATTQQQNEQHLLSATTAGATIHIPAELNSANNTINSANISDDTDDDRERSMTLGSEFDIIMKDGRGMSISDYYYNNSNSRLRGDSTASASNFLNGLFDQSFITVPEVVSSSHQEGEVEEEQQQQYEQNSLSNLSQQLAPIGGGGQSSINNNMKNDTNNIKKKMMISHTPPTQFGLNSYEYSHFGKRMRSGVS